MSHFVAGVEPGDGVGRMPAGSRADPPQTAAAGSGTFETIQVLRAVAALLVVLYHAFEMWNERVAHTMAEAPWVNGAAGVDIFFVISGFVMVISSRRLAERPRAWFAFLRHRVVRIVPLYWILTTAKLAAVLLAGGLALRTSTDPGFIVRSYLFLPLVDEAGHFRPLLPVGWTLTYEFLFYLIFALALALRTEALRVVVSGLGIIAGLALLRTAAWPTWTILFDTIVLEFAAGVWLARLTLRGWRLPPAIAAGLVAAGLILLLVLPFDAENGRVLLWGIPATAVVAGAISLEPLIGRALPRWATALGDASYSIYLGHGFVLPVIGVLVGRTGWSSLPVEILTIALTVVASATAGMVLYRVVERPIIRALKR